MRGILVDSALSREREARKSQSRTRDKSGAFLSVGLMRSERRDRYGMSSPRSTLPSDRGQAHVVVLEHPADFRGDELRMIPHGRHDLRARRTRNGERGARLTTARGGGQGVMCFALCLVLTREALSHSLWTLSRYSGTKAFRWTLGHTHWHSLFSLAC
jgi:hypothetical protein